MTAPTARQVLASLDRSRQAIQMQALTALGGAGEAAVRRALSAVKPSAKIDVPLLLESVRLDLTAQAARRPPGEAWRYGLSLIGDEALHSLRDRLRQRVAAGDGSEPFLSGSIGIATNGHAHDEEPDPDEDDDDDLRPKSIPRRRSRRGGRGVDQADPAPDPPASPKTRPAPPQSRMGRLLHGRVFVGGLDMSPEPIDFATPPWVLADDVEAA